MKKNILVMLIITIHSTVCSQQMVDNFDSKLNLQPQPKSIVSLKKSLLIEHENIFMPITVNKVEEKKAAAYLLHILKQKFNIPSNLNSVKGNDSKLWKIRIELVEYSNSFPNDQFYSIEFLEELKEIKISSPSQLGLLFGVVTFLEFVRLEKNKIIIDCFNVKDWPLFKRREISAKFNSSNVNELLDFALKNKIETLAIASRNFSWFKIDDEYKLILQKIKTWKEKYGGPKIMQMHNIYDRKHIEISNRADIDSLKKVIEFGINHGIEKLMILADDTPPFKFGQGYILTSENDKMKFKHMMDAHCYLMSELKNWMGNKSLNSELYYVPPFYTYEDMNYGDLELYKGTPWEKDAYQPLKRDLEFIGKNIPEDVFIIWCGPNVRSRKITSEDLLNWSNNLSGRTPYLWDNTIYSHHPFTSTPLFTAYCNDLPKDFYLSTAGNGMFVNGDASSEDSKASVITVNDYLWDSKNYDPQKSISLAMERLYSKELLNLLFNLKDAELELRKKIGERKLWFESDTLWTTIRKIRFIHDKNPFHYHLNYSRMKALRLQLKNSIPEPLTKDEFINECIKLDQLRNNILEKIKMIDKKIYERVKIILIPMPNFKTIQ